MATADEKDRRVHAWFEARFSALRDGELDGEEHAAVKSHLDECAACQTAWDDFDGALGALSSLNRTAAPPDLGATVEERIRKRSGGRFFGRRGLGDRIPFGWLAALAFLVLAVIYLLVRASGSGTLRVPDPQVAPPHLAPGAKEAMPKP
ncbi:MAG TPA: anti-sigma factor [Kofleriaceae bacterium]|nr:anti-sigma factor [Kofleriaceae bacterium]